MKIKEIGEFCAAIRGEIGATQKDVAEDTGYTIQSISAFENGRTNNAEIFSWYLEQGQFINVKVGDCDD